jgi:EPS-associated MarR family transcriptional regulator
MEAGDSKTQTLGRRPRDGTGTGGSVPDEIHTMASKDPPSFPTESEFQVLRHLDGNPTLSQREIGQRAGISLGAVNYCLKALISKGFVKAENFSKSANRSAYLYHLTPSGIAEKSKLTGRFLKRKLAEYEALRLEIEALSAEMSPKTPQKEPEGHLNLR